LKRVAIRNCCRRIFRQACLIPKNLTFEKSMVQETHFRKTWCRKISKNSIAKIFPFSPPPSFPKSCVFSARMDRCFDKVPTMYVGPCVGQGICRDCSIRTGCPCGVSRLSWDTWRPRTSLPSPSVWRRSLPIDRARLKACPSTTQRYKLWVSIFFAVLHREIGHLTQGTDLCGTRQSFTTPLSSAVSLISSRLFHRPLPPGIPTYIGGSISFRPDIQRPRQMQNALRDI